MISIETARALCHKSRKDYFLQNIYARKNTGQDRAELVWMQLRVTRKLNCVILRAALHIALKQLVFGSWDHHLDELANATLEVLRVTFKLASSDKTQDQITWTIVKTYLWNAWQRIMMLYLHEFFEVRQTKRKGVEWPCSIRVHTLQGLDLIPELSHLRHNELSKQLRAIPYLCSWSYKLLFETNFSLTADFRWFFQAYSRLHGKKDARCNGLKQCHGGSSAGCKRFISEGVINQSAHDTSCLGSCRKLSWDEDSFRSIQGAQAVCLREAGEKLHYTVAGENTMAVSHVWSHGQGGRPEPWTSQTPEGTGFNSCLHRRYTDLARGFDCSSYWMDTPCIPSEVTLKIECIKHINEIFAQSKVTLICDRDIMDIDISDSCMETLESVLATLLVCDWNLRAWTLLEGLRGRANLHLLCKQNKTIPVIALLQTIYQYGNISLSFMAMESKHLMVKYGKKGPEADDDVNWMEWDPDEDLGLKKYDFLTIEGAAQLLNHRHMTRTQDDVIIWGYLNGNTLFRNPVELWRSQIGEMIYRNFIVSKSPRIKGHKGLGWAPDRPTGCYTPLEIEQSRCMILAEGLKGKWLIHELIIHEDVSLKAQFESFPTTILELIKRNQDQYAHFAILQAGDWMTNKTTSRVKYRETEHPLVVVCASHNPKAGWEWVEPIEWKGSQKLPEFRFKEILLV